MKTGAFRRKKVNFTQVSNNIIQNPNVSTSAKGLYTIINSYINIPDWTLYKNFLLNQCKESKTAFERMWKELKTLGYLKQYRIKDKDTGMFIYEYELLDVPEIEEKDVSEIEEKNIVNIEGKLDFPQTVKTKKESVVVDSSILNIQSKIKDKTNLLIHEKSIIKLLESKTEDKIMYYADNWNKIISTSKGEVGGGLFIDAVMKEYSLPQKNATKQYEIENMSNFEQREYSTEDYEQYYYKVTE